MSEFSGRKFYGWSPQHDPSLTTTTRNFEFRYTRPECLDRLIQKVQLPDEKPKKMAKSYKVKHNETEMTAVSSRDLDVETHMSRHEMNKVRPLSANEVDQLIGKVRSSTRMPAPPPERDFITLPLGAGYARAADKVGTDSGAGHNQDTGVAMKKRPSAELNAIIEDVSDEEVEPKEWGFATLEGYNNPQPQWVEVIETSRAHSAVIECVDKEYMVTTLPCSEMPMQGYIPGVMTASEMGDRLAMDSSTLPYDQMNPEAYYVEDSDLEYEMLGRAEYEKYCSPRPKIEEMADASTDGGFAEFIEMEPQIPSMSLSFLKNASPMRYSDLTDEDQLQRSDDHKMRVFSPTPHEPVAQPSVKSKISKGADSKKAQPKKKLAKAKPLRPTPPPKDRTPSPRSKISKYMESARNAAPRTPRNQRPKLKSARAVHNERTFKNLVMSKSIEELKMEKIGIFSKMTATQERIIEVLDKLKINLLEMYVPDNSFEKSKRQRNAFEFSVRFSRNFLYPLKGMIEDLKQTSVEQLNSASSNDACSRVGAIYSLIYQSLQTYQKQLRFFLLDQVPQKLKTLIEMIYGATNISLDKAVFDRNDAIIDCLQERCTKFLSFLEDMHEERFLTARENYRRMSSDKSHSNYNLKMFMNDLNMYEPKLVPKHPQSRRRNQRKIGQIPMKKSHVGCPMAGSSEIIMTQIPEDTISTQIENDNDNDVFGSSGLLNSVQSILSNDALRDRRLESGGHLSKAIMEALQTVTKEQVRQVLEPLIHSLGSAIDKKNDSEKIDCILSDFRSQLYGLTQKGRRKVSNTNAPNTVKESTCVVHNEISSESGASSPLKAAKRTEFQRQRNTRETPSVRFASNDDEDEADSEVCDYDDDDEHTNGESGKCGVKSGGSKPSTAYDTTTASPTATATASPTTPTSPASTVSTESPEPSSVTMYTSVPAWALRSTHSGTDTETTDGDSATDYNNVPDFKVILGNVKQKPNEQQQQQPQQQQPQQLPDKPHKQPELALHMRPQARQKPHPKKQQASPQSSGPSGRRPNFRQHMHPQHMHPQHMQPQHQPVPRRGTVRKPAPSVAASSAAGGLKCPPFKTPSCPVPSAAQSRLILRKMSASSNMMTGGTELPCSVLPPMLNHTNSLTVTSMRKPRLVRKRRNPLLPPPPVPAATPSTSARTRDGHLSAEDRSAGASGRSAKASIKTSAKSSAKMSPCHSCRSAAGPLGSARSGGGKTSAKMSPMQSVRSAAGPLGSARSGGKTSAKMSPIQGAKSMGKMTASSSHRTGARLNATSTCTSLRSGFRLAAGSGATRPRSQSTARFATNLQNPGTPDIPLSVVSPVRLVSTATSTGTSNVTIPPAAKTTPRAPAARVTQSAAGLSAATLRTYLDEHGTPRGLPLTQPFDLADNDMDINRLSVMQNRCIANILNKCFIKGEINEENSAEINGALNEVLKDLTQTAMPLFVDKSPYQSTWAPTPQQQLHEQELKRNQLQQKREEERRQRHEHLWQQQHEGLIVDLEPHLQHRPSAGGDNNAPQPPPPKNSPVEKPEKECNTFENLKIADLMKERECFLKSCSRNRFYDNPNFSEPWKVFSKIADALTSELFTSIQKDFTVGVSKFVDDFLDVESHS